MGFLDRAVGVAIVVALASGTAACGDVRLKAPRAQLLLADDAILPAGPADSANLLVGGETVITVVNDGGVPRRVVLAEIDAASSDELPSTLRRADDIDDDDRIVALSDRLDAREATFASGGLGYVRESHRFHVHLERGRSYVVFDSLHDGALFMRFRPGAST